MRHPQRPIVQATDLKIEFVYNRFLSESSDLDILQQVLGQMAPKWMTRLRIRRSARDQRGIDTQSSNGLRTTAVEAATERGETYRQMVELYGEGPNVRQFGSAEFRGAGPELIVVVSVDEWPVSPLAGKKQLGNSIWLQVLRPQVNKIDSAAWARDFFRRICQETSPSWASAEHPDEYWEKVMEEKPSISAVGRNMGRYLPGLFWLNYFGGPFVRSLGMEKLTSAPTENVEALGDGVMIPLGDDPQAWDTPEYALLEERVRAHLGRDLFYSREDPDRDSTIDWLVE